MFNDAARRVSALVGDGCVIRARRGSDLVAIAADHRDSARRKRLRAALARPLPSPGGWVGQALERDCILRVPEVDPETLGAVGLPPSEAIGDVVVVPLAPAEAVIVAIRDQEHMPFSFAERLILERVAAETIETLSLEEGRALANGGPEAHRGEREELPHLLDLTAAGLWLVDSAGTTVWVNESASELVGIPASELVGAEVPQFIAGAEGALGGNLYAEERSDRKLRRPDGSEVWLSATARPLFDDRGYPRGTLMTMLEINERKRREVDLRIRLEAKEALVSLAELSLDAPNLRAILAESVEMVAEQLDAALASISAVDIERRELRVLAAFGQTDARWAKELEQRGPIRVPDSSLALAAIETAEPVVVEDFANEPSVEQSPQLAEHGIRSAAVVPLGDGESVIAALGQEPRAVGRAALPLIESVARVIANYQALAGTMPGRECTEHHGGATPHAPSSPGCRESASSRPWRWSRRPGSG